MEHRNLVLVIDDVQEFISKQYEGQKISIEKDQLRCKVREILEVKLISYDEEQLELDYKKDEEEQS